jgi:hypothetical protein
VATTALLLRLLLRLRLRPLLPAIAAGRNRSND